MYRRGFLRRGAAGTSLGVAGLGGCLEDGDGDDGDEDDREPGFALERGDVPAPDADPSSFERLDVGGIEVPLVPIDVAYPWYRRRDARFVDARSRAQFQHSHVAGAVLSPAPTGYEEDDPTGAWPNDERIVTYCGCPHHLSSQRAASLIEAGFTEVYALDEGFVEWVERDYPVGSASEVRTTLGTARTVRGSTDPGSAGELVWLRHPPTGQREPAAVGADGRFELTFRFVELDPDSELVLETPTGRRVGTVASLTDGTVRQ